MIISPLSLHPPPLPSTCTSTKPSGVSVVNESQVDCVKEVEKGKKYNTFSW